MSRGVKTHIISFFAVLLLPIFAAGANQPANGGGDIIIKATLSSPTAIVNETVTYTVTVEGENIPTETKPKVSGLFTDGISLQAVDSSRSIISGSSMTVVINGKVIKDDKDAREIVEYNYHLIAQKTGTYKIGPAVIRLDNVDYSSPQVSLRVNSMPNADVLEEAPSEVFIHAKTSGTKLWAGQIFTVAYHFYFRNDIDVERLTGETLPELDGFIRYDFEQPTGRPRVSRITLKDGGVYKRAYIGRLIVFPTRTGILTLDPYRQGYVQASQMPGHGIFQQYRRVERTAVSQSISIEVSPLPTEGRPDKFSGAIGDFKVEFSLDRDNVRTGESIAMTVKVTGTGNLEGAADPVVQLPRSIESYPPEKQDDVSAIESNLAWERTYKFILVPDKSGETSIGPVYFHYFDPEKGEYSTSTANAIKVNVMPGKQTRSSVENSGPTIKKPLTDIRYIKPDLQSLKNGRGFSIDKTWYIAAHFASLIFVGLAVLVRKRRDRMETDGAYARKLKSRDRASKKLEAARKAIGKSSDDFHRELYNSISGYISDMLNLPEAGTAPREFAVHLEQAGAADGIINEVVDLLETCRAARYLPGNASKNEKELHKKATKIIKTLRSAIKETPVK